MPLALLRLLADKEIMVGSINVATDRVETPEKVRDTIKAALAHVDAQRLYPCTNCGMAPLPRAVAAAKLRALGAGAALARAALGAGRES